VARKLKKDWIQSYMEYVSLSEAPDVYNQWAAISAIASTLKRNVYIPRGTYRIYPNQYVILIGGPGLGKGEAIKPSVEIVEEANTANILPDRITAEKIIDRLAAGFTTHITQANGTILAQKDSTATIISTELPVFLGASDWMLPLMCELWDKGEFSYDTKTKGFAKIKDLSVGLLGGCVPDYIRKLNKDVTAFITSGFSSRAIFVYASEKSKMTPWPDMSKIGVDKADLIEDLRAMSQLRGEVKFDYKARQLWDIFYTTLKPKQFESDIVANFKARKVAHVLKLCQVLTANQDDTLIVTASHLQNAITLVNDVEAKLEVTFRGVGDSPLAAAQDRVLTFIEQKGFVSRSEILKYNYRHVTDEDLTRVLYVATIAGLILEEFVGTKQYYRWVKIPTQTKAKGAGVP
jgi:hypothetical protein